VAEIQDKHRYLAEVFLTGGTILPALHCTVVDEYICSQLGKTSVNGGTVNMAGCAFVKDQNKQR
jgi:hypothetical protein